MAINHSIDAKTNLKDNRTIGNYLKHTFCNKNVLNALVLTLLFLLLYHLGTQLSLPGVVLPENYKPNTSSFVQMLNLLAAGGLDKMSLFAIGLGPYITSQIIVQLMSTDLVRPLSNMAKAGERGKRKLEIINRLLTFPFCLIQSYATLSMMLNTGTGITIFGASTIGDVPVFKIFFLMILLTSGTYIAIFFGDLITKRGLGNGVTTLILAGIVGSIISDFSYAFTTISDNLSHLNDHILSVLSCILYVSFFIVLLVIITFINDSTRKIPVQQTGQGLITNKNNLPFLPIKLMAGGVIPVIFASSIITIPSTIAQFLPNGDAKTFIQDYLTLNQWSGLAIYFVLIILFSFFYSYVQINPPQMAENFQKHGKFIPGIKMGEDTEKHISRVLFRVNWLGAPLLALIASLPYALSIITKIPSGLALGGTGIIIMVTASIELWNAIKSASTTSSYTKIKKSVENTHYMNNDQQQEVSSLW